MCVFSQYLKTDDHINLKLFIFYRQRFEFLKFRIYKILNFRPCGQTDFFGQTDFVGLSADIETETICRLVLSFLPENCFCTRIPQNKSQQNIFHHDFALSTYTNYLIFEYRHKCINNIDLVARVGICQVNTSLLTIRLFIVLNHGHFNTYMNNNKKLARD